jgi:hypothetical protein
MIPIFVVVSALLVAQAGLTAVVASWVGAPAAAMLLAAWRAQVAPAAPATPVPSHWEPRTPEEVSHVP